MRTPRTHTKETTDWRTLLLLSVFKKFSAPCPVNDPLQTYWEVVRASLGRGVSSSVTLPQARKSELPRRQGREVPSYRPTTDNSTLNTDTLACVRLYPEKVQVAASMSPSGKMFPRSFQKWILTTVTAIKIGLKAGWKTKKWPAGVDRFIHGVNWGTHWLWRAAEQQLPGTDHLTLPTKWQEAGRSLCPGFLSHRQEFMFPTCLLNRQMAHTTAQVKAF